MRGFYEQVRTDAALSQFYAVCPICGKRQYGRHLPFLCRGSRTANLCETGQAGRLRQFAYNKSRVDAVQSLARYFNFCRACGRWVCDGCFRKDDDICSKCIP